MVVNFIFDGSYCSVEILELRMGYFARTTSLDIVAVMLVGVRGASKNSQTWLSLLFFWTVGYALWDFVYLQIPARSDVLALGLVQERNFVHHSVAAIVEHGGWHSYAHVGGPPNLPVFWKMVAELVYYHLRREVCRETVAVYDAFGRLGDYDMLQKIIFLAFLL